MRVHMRLTLATAVIALSACKGLSVNVQKPAPETAAAGQVAADIRGQDHTGKAVTLSDMVGDGRVVVVFYRGHW